MKERIIYYKDELNDDFARTKNHSRIIINGKYNYMREKNIFWRMLSYFLHYIIVKPVSHLIMVFGYHYKIVNRKAFKKIKGGALVYSNHTNYMPDAFIPNHLARKKSYIVVDSTAVSIRHLKNIVMALGAIPLGDTLEAKKNFMRFLKLRSKDSLITIYPEAHIWPYYTKIRQFLKDSIRYSIILDRPAFAVTNCYQKRKIGKKPRMISYVDGPFYPDRTLDKNSMIDKLYEEIINTMRSRVELYSTYEYVKYIKVENDADL